MMFAKYKYPLPNNGTGYSFTEPELIELLDSVYNEGFSHGVQVATPPETTHSTNGATRLVINLHNDNKSDWTKIDFHPHTAEHSQ